MSKRKKDVFSAVAQVKSNARDRIGTPKASFAITPKHEKPARYKTSMRDLIAKANDEDHDTD
jgi:hypothetical protein